MNQLQNNTTPTSQKEPSNLTDHLSADLPQKQEWLSHTAPSHSFLRKLTGKRWRRRVPVLLQMSSVECGAACLAMILSYYGHATTVSEIRERCSPDRDGLSAHTLVNTARSYGLRVRPVTLREHDLRYASLPAIIHWEFNHFLVLEHWTSTSAEVIDPG